MEGGKCSFIRGLGYTVIFQNDYDNIPRWTYREMCMYGSVGRTASYNTEFTKLAKMNVI
jgi:hypothetical protein